MSGKQPSGFFTPSTSKFGSKTDEKTAVKVPKITGKEIDVPDYMKRGAIFYHATTRAFADQILHDGIDPDRQGNVNALGPGFYTVKDIADVWQWWHPDTTAMANKTNEERKKYLADNHSIIMIEIVTVPTKVYDGWHDKAEVVVKGTDVSWTKTGVLRKLVKVNGDITGKVLRSRPEFEAWYKKTLKVKETV
ncbi:hypothetical protein TWF694_004676 [Orbilia ellipsospora]|uniref:Uncharacterized protein n=1 Tax=Orbilia ellipsospora TaxID=2528407 RepID=A0AAV9WY35_9PEZI